MPPYRTAFCAPLVLPPASCLSISRPYNPACSRRPELSIPRSRHAVVRATVAGSSVSSSPSTSSPTPESTSASATQLPLSDNPPPAPLAIQTANVVVVGSGPSGLLAALFLHARGLHVTIVERVVDVVTFDITRTYTLALIARGVRVIKLLPGLLSNIKQQSSNSSSAGLTMNVDENGTLFTGVDSRQMHRFEFYRSTRFGILSALRAMALACAPRITILTGAKVVGLSFANDGTSTLSIEREGRMETIGSKLILACDGRNSEVLSQLREATGSNVLKSTHGFKEVIYDTPTSHLVIRTIVLSKDINDFIKEKLDESMANVDLNGTSISLFGKKDRPANRMFRITSTPMLPQHISQLGGRIGMLSLPRSHAIWRLTSVEEGFALFEENFPNLDVRRFVSEESMRQFIGGKAIRSHGPGRRPSSLVAHVGSGRRGGVVVLGDAAHSFPPDLGLGLNVAFEDVAMFARVLDDAEEDVDVGTILERYEERRLADVKAMLHIVSCASRFRRSTRFFKLFSWNQTLRRKLSSMFPRVFYKSMLSMTLDDISFSENKRRSDVTSRRLFYCLAVIVVALKMLIALMAYIARATSGAV